MTKQFVWNQSLMSFLVVFGYSGGLSAFGNQNTTSGWATYKEDAQVYLMTQCPSPSDYEPSWVQIFFTSI